jgi:hypothetical protein
MTNLQIRDAYRWLADYAVNFSDYTYKYDEAADEYDYDNPIITDEFTIDDLIFACIHYLELDEGYCLGHNTPDAAYDGNQEMWENFEIVTRKGVPDSQKDTFFRCAC